MAANETSSRTRGLMWWGIALLVDRGGIRRLGARGRNHCSDLADGRVLRAGSDGDFEGVVIG